MKINLVRAALACAVLAFTNVAVMAGEEPVPGIDVVVHSHGGKLMVHKTTNPQPGKYQTQDAKGAEVTIKHTNRRGKFFVGGQQDLNGKRTKPIQSNK